jgi:hypothetical protein
MDLDEAMKLLRGGREGISEWNRRRLNGDEIPSLVGADLHGADLHGADLHFANLDGARLYQASLYEASFYKASLDSADLRRADLRGADLDRADLRRADLREADLRWADLRWAALGGADLGGAICNSTSFADVDLSEVKGLESVQHVGPSTLGTDTLIRSRGKIPEAFVRGCGLPDAWIANLPALIGALEPIQFYSCFVSYSHADEEFARRLHSRLRDEGLRVWYAPEDIKGGEKIHEQIDQAIRVHDKLLLVLSEHSLQSEWVKTEIRKARRAEAREGKRKLFPIRLVPIEVIRDWECFDADGGKDLGVEIREYYIPDFSRWREHDAFEESFDRLLRDLKAENSAGS